MTLTKKNEQNTKKLEKIIIKTNWTIVNCIKSKNTKVNLFPFTATHNNGENYQIRFDFIGVEMTPLMVGLDSN